VFTLNSNVSQLNTDGTDTTIVASPASGKRVVRNIVLHNRGSIAVNVLVKINSNVFWNLNLASLESFTIETPFVLGSADSVTGRRASGTTEVVNFIASYGDMT